MKTYLFSSLLILLALTLTPLTFVQAATSSSLGDSDSDVQEVSYDQLISEISSSQKKILRDSTHPFDDVRIHAQMGYINSFSHFETKASSLYRYENGMQISLGADLFSEKLQAEASYQNFGINQNGSEELLMRNLDLKFIYNDVIENPWSYRLISGISHRILRIRNSSPDLNVEQSTPGVLLGAGVLLHLNKLLSVGLDITGRSALLPSTADRESFQFGFMIRASM